MEANPSLRPIQRMLLWLEWSYSPRTSRIFRTHIHARARARIPTPRARGCLLIKVHNLQTDRQSLGIQPSRMQNPAYIVYIHAARARERERENGGWGRGEEWCSLVLLEYPDISGSHCSLNSRAYPIYGALRFKTAICENNFNLGENRARSRARDPPRGHRLRQFGFTRQLTATQIVPWLCTARAHCGVSPERCCAIASSSIFFFFFLFLFPCKLESSFSLVSRRKVASGSSVQVYRSFIYTSLSLFLHPIRKTYDLLKTACMYIISLVYAIKDS
jgi:hypothetical protein